MKLILLILSLALNAVVVAAMWSRSQSSHAPVREEAVVVNSGSRVTAPSRVPVGARFETDDVRTLRDRLRAAGFPPHMVNAIVVAHVHQVGRARLDAHRYAGSDREFWLGSANSNMEDLRTNMRIGAETSDLLRELLGPGYDQSARRRAESAHQYGSIAPDKVESLERLQNDYRDLMRSYHTGFFQLPSGRETLEFIEGERQADLAALLTPSERFEYQLRTSNSARRLSHSLRGFDASEDEFRQLYSKLAPTTEDQLFGGFVVLTPNAVESGNQKLLADAATVLSPERVADLEQVLRPGAGFENATATRLGLPLSAARQLFEARTEVRAKNDAERAAQEKGDEAAAAAERLDPERGQQIWTELVETFGEETLRSLRPVTGGKWLRTIIPVPPETGG